MAKALLLQFQQRGVAVTEGPALPDIVRLQAERCKTLSEMAEKSLYFYQNDIVLDEQAVKNQLKSVVLVPLEALYDAFQALNAWEKDALQMCINDICARFDLSMGKIAQPLRVAITGGTQSPAIDMTLKLIGKTRVLLRLDAALSLIRERAEAAGESLS